MQIYPAIDLRAGKCVRLIQGEYHRQITYKDNPVEQALEFKQAGSDNLHIVDLDGAKVGKCVNAKAIEAISKAVDMRIQVGGGIRDEDSIKMILDLGVDNVILGTSAVTNFSWFCKMTDKFPNQLILGLDAKGSKVAVEGWTQQSQQTLTDFAEQAADLSIFAIVYTDISKDGMLEGPNFERTKNMSDSIDCRIICAGGVTEVDDVIRLKELEIYGAIIGRSLYEGRIDLKEALAAAK